LTALPEEIGQLTSLGYLYVDRLAYMIICLHHYKGVYVTIN